LTSKRQQFPVQQQARVNGGQLSNARMQVPEIAFTGDTQIEFADLPENADVFQAKLLIMECTFVDDTVDVARAKENGHTHIRDLVQYADKFQVCLPELACLTPSPEWIRMWRRPATMFLRSPVSAVKPSFSMQHCSQGKTANQSTTWFH